MPKYTDVRQQILWHYLEEKANDWSNTIVNQVCKDFLKRGRKERIPKIQTESLSDYEKKADNIFSKWILKRDKCCITCGTRRQGTNSHLFKRGRQSTRFNEFNNNRQCEPCNNLHNTNQEPYKNWFIAKHGEEKYNELEMLSRQLKHWTLEEYKEIIQKYGISKL